MRQRRPAFHPTLRAAAPSRQNRLCCPASPRAGMRTIFCGSETAVPITCAARSCALRIASVRSASVHGELAPPRLSNSCETR